ncbi:MAG: UPF0149 family protein [Hydrogenophaga sp.]|uniref:UPF0149 family protein n=1 Tax=Hydrogenophaga sp. TaxID=1904254 RepID=UPI001D797670|nr:UPF0149 family protein [Hydrogenophaga sp.]MBX3611869.1 UPF0149 family protein [Hydrogenophaga sp.]
MDTAKPSPLEGADFDELDALLDELRTRDDEVPEWEFLEGAMAALLCTRRPVPAEEWLPVLLGTGPLPTVPHADGTHFPNTAAYERFLSLWQRREAEVREALSADIEALDDPRSYHPEVMDVRGAIAALPEAERPAADVPIPSYGQVWALGYLFVVEQWTEEWALPRDQETASWIERALDEVDALTQDDTARPSVNLHNEQAAPSVSEPRLDAFASAIWSVYDLYRIWHSLGPRQAPVRQAPAPGRNDPCWCGSGIKFKRCHGA